VRCPHCGAKNDLSEEVAKLGENLKQWQCGKCQRPFKVQIFTTFTVYAQP
jgi:transposase-like protein